MIGDSFKSVGRVITVAIAAMGLYLVTSQVAAERTQLERTNRQIVAAKKEIRRLHTELGTRANLRQLERWNGEVLALTTPDADQFVMEEAQLASLDRSGIVPGPRYAPASMVTAMVGIPDSALATVPAAATTPAAAPSAAPAPKPAAPTATATASAAPVQRVVTQRVAMVKDVTKREPRALADASKAKPKPEAQPKAQSKPIDLLALARAEPAPKPRSDSAKPADRAKADKASQLARLEDKLLDDRLMGELNRAARTERGGRRAQ